MVAPLAGVGRRADLDRGWMTPGKLELGLGRLGVRYLVAAIQAERTGRQLVGVREGVAQWGKVSLWKA